jgi:hypothetical protein
MLATLLLVESVAPIESAVDTWATVFVAIGSKAARGEWSRKDTADDVVVMVTEVRRLRHDDGRSETDWPPAGPCRDLARR